MAPVLAFQSIMGRPGEPARIKLPQGFDSDDWDHLEPFYREKIGEGHLHWEVDLTDLQYFSSTMLGLLLGLNTILAIRGGTLRIIVSKTSRLAQLLMVTRVNQIMDVVEF